MTNTDTTDEQQQDHGQTTTTITTQQEPSHPPIPEDNTHDERAETDGFLPNQSPPNFGQKEDDNNMAPENDKEYDNTDTALMDTETTTPGKRPATQITDHDETPDEHEAKKSTKRTKKQNQRQKSKQI